MAKLVRKVKMRHLDKKSTIGFSSQTKSELRKTTTQTATSPLLSKLYSKFVRSRRSMPNDREGVVGGR